MTPPRTMTRGQLRAYLQIPLRELESLLAARQLPPPLWGKAPGDKDARWDRIAVDRALDAAAAPEGSVAAAEAHLDQAFGFR